MLSNTRGPAARRVTAVAVVAGICATLTVGTASANRPTTTPISGTPSTVATTLCPFPVTVDSTLDGIERVFTDRSGNVVRIQDQFTEQDTFSANGNVLVGLPFHNRLTVLFDAAGNVTHVYEVGVIERVPLPGGQVFLSAGRVDFSAHGDAAFLLTPDKGRSGDLGAFCAALA